MKRNQDYDFGDGLFIGAVLVLLLVGFLSTT